jgi:RNA polymerase sigma-70 factor (sigma-E family)
VWSDSQSSIQRDNDLCVLRVMLNVEGAVTSSALSSRRAGDLFRRHCAEAVRLAYLLTGDRHLAEDLAQDAFVRCFGRFHDLRRPDAFASYLKRAIVNLSKDHFRRLQRERIHSDRVRQLGAEEDVHLSQVDAHDELLQALQALPPRQRVAVVLRHCEGLSELETADVLGTSVRAVNSLVARGLTTLRQKIEREMDE